jgi:hypothetical protein
VPQFGIGPTYCETLSATYGAFPVEPANTASNAVIVLFGLASLYFVIKRTPRAYDLYVLSALLIATGIGSGFWHGLRDGSALFWEVRAGLFFLFGLAFCWSRRLWSYAGAILFLAAFSFGFQMSREYLVTAQRWVAIAPVVILFGSMLAGQTLVRSKKAALLGLGAMALSLTALGFRTYDLAVCDAFPVGTHWLWHMFNSAGGFTAMLAIITLQTQGAPKRRTEAVGEAAE